MTEKEYQKKYREEHKEYQKKYREEHKKELAEKNKKYRQEHSDQILESSKKYYSENKEKRLKYYREHKKEHAEYGKKYRQEHKEKIAPQRENYRLVKKYGITLAERDVMYNAQNGRCAICGEQHNVLCVDHDHSTGKIRELLCKKCNRKLGMLEYDMDRIHVMLAYLEKHI
jgi:hypothetical protein